MSATAHPDAAEPDAAVFRLFWTVGFTGKRFLHENPSEQDEAEARAARALGQALDFLAAEARRQEAQLSAVSSISRGGDVLFSRACQRPGSSREPIPWKCLFPFGPADFFALDLAKEFTGEPLDPAKRQRLRQEAGECVQNAAYQPEICGKLEASSGADAANQRVVAYLECGYRTVDEADVMICLLRAPEFQALAGEPAAVRSPKAGSLQVAQYAIAARRPCILLNADAPDPWAQRRIVNDPAASGGEWFADPEVSPVVIRAAQAVPAKPVKLPPGPNTPLRASVARLQRNLSELAVEQQGETQGGLSRILSLHLAATSIAALSATVLHFNSTDHLALWIVLGLIVLAFTKPLLAFLAERIEHRLHHSASREQWLRARELAETCRGALSLWPLPIQPLDAADEEDFPKLKRLLRTLRLLRALKSESAAAVHGTPPQGPSSPARPWESETPLEADMRAATALYIESRLLEQASHYREKREHSLAIERCWHRVYSLAIWSAIGFGTLLAMMKLFQKAGVISAHHAGAPYADLNNWLAAIVTIAPFAASFALGIMTIRDCRRRVRRYAEMHGYLTRTANTLAACRANPSRLRLIEQAERMMIEEQHEWFSVTRNFNV